MKGVHPPAWNPYLSAQTQTSLPSRVGYRIGQALEIYWKARQLGPVICFLLDPKPQKGLQSLGTATGSVWQSYSGNYSAWSGVPAAWEQFQGCLSGFPAPEGRRRRPLVVLSAKVAIPDSDGLLTGYDRNRSTKKKGKVSPLKYPMLTSRVILTSFMGTSFPLIRQTSRMTS